MVSKAFSKSKRRSNTEMFFDSVQIKFYNNTHNTKICKKCELITNVMHVTSIGIGIGSMEQKELAILLLDIRTFTYILCH